MKRFKKVLVDNQETVNVFTSVGMVTIDMVPFAKTVGSIVIPDGFALVRDGATNLYGIVKE